MSQAMSDSEKDINNYYQLETIHPFLDENGGIGRILITLMLLNAKILSSLHLYTALFLKSNRIEYYDRLSEVRVKGNYERRIKFFLRRIIETCNDSIDTINRSSVLIAKDAELIAAKRDFVKKVYRFIKEYPIFEIGKTVVVLSISFHTVSSAVKSYRNSVS